VRQTERGRGGEEIRERAGGGGSDAERERRNAGVVWGAKTRGRFYILILCVPVDGGGGGLLISLSDLLPPPLCIKLKRKHFTMLIASCWIFLWNLFSNVG